MKLNQINEDAIPDSKLAEIIYHKYSTIRPESRDRVAKMLMSGTISYVQRRLVTLAVKAIQAGIAVEDNYSTVSAILADADGYYMRGAILLVGASPTNALRVLYRYSNLEADSGRDPADWWKEAENIEIDPSSDDYAFLGIQNGSYDWVDAPDDITPVKVYYTGVLKNNYEIVRTRLSYKTPVLILADDEFEATGLSRIVASQEGEKQELRDQRRIQDVVNKYGITVIDIRN